MNVIPIFSGIKLRTFFDTSVWIAAILSDRGASYMLLDRAIRGDFVIVSSPDVFEEATRNLGKKYPVKLADFYNQFYKLRPFLVAPNKVTVLRAARLVHPDDAPILAAALKARVDFLVTLDRRHLLGHARQIQHATDLVVVTPGTFLHELE